MGVQRWGDGDGQGAVAAGAGTAAVVGTARSGATLVDVVCRVLVDAGDEFVRASDEFVVTSDEFIREHRWALYSAVLAAWSSGENGWPWWW